MRVSGTTKDILNPVSVLMAESHSVGKYAAVQLGLFLIRLCHEGKSLVVQRAIARHLCAASLPLLILDRHPRPLPS